MILAMFPTIVLVVFSQLVVKWRVTSLAGDLGDATDRITRLISYLKDPYIVSSYVAALAASVAWMFVVERYAISVVFPIYVGLTIVAVAVGGCLLFDESLGPSKVFAIILIVAGVSIASRS
jgi:multidrug transporter EmrE-like cation transporter